MFWKIVDQSKLILMWLKVSNSIDISGVVQNIQDAFHKTFLNYPEQSGLSWNCNLQVIVEYSITLSNVFFILSLLNF